MKPYYITTAITYTSRKPHIGNTYEIVLTDALARYHRMKGEDVFFCTGTDEHGQKIEEIAAQEKITPKEYVDRIAGDIRRIWDTMNVSYDYFIRTTDEAHERVVQKIFKKLYEQGDIYKGAYEGWYCTPCESFWTETQLVDGKCPDCGREVKKTREEAYFFRMSKYQDRLTEYIESHPDFIVPESRKREMVNNFLKPGLQDLCVSRSSFQWGIPVDFDPKHIVYVWIDALTNYITALGYDPDGSSENFKKYWPADVHVIGKDILRFHTIYWPIMLMALDLPLPKQVFGHPWMLFGTDKMSKSRGNVLYADDLAEQFGLDGIRYYMLSEMPFAQDGSITYETIIERYNADLANTLGNLVNRTVSMVQKYFGGVIPTPQAYQPLDDELRTLAAETVAEVDRQMLTYHVSDALSAIFALARRSNKYIDETTPWTLAKTEEGKARLQTVLYVLLESIRYLGVLLTPFMPQSAAAILEQIGNAPASYASLSAFGGIRSGERVGTPVPLFSRIDEKEKMKEIEAAMAKSTETPEGIASITIDDFAKVELTVAKVTACEKVKKSKKLLCLQLDDGQGGRQVVSGISTWYAPEDLIGKKVVLVSNLAPAKLCGVESNGMILAADCPNGDVRVIFVDDAIPQGSKIR